jgi:uncharacterized protein
MTAQEQQMLQGLVERINATPLPEKDTEAEQYLQQTIGRNPDGLYILAQAVLVQQYALTQAQKQLADAKADAEQLRQQAQQPKHATSFLGSLLGRSEEPARPAPPPPPPSAYAQPQYTPVPNTPPPPAYAPSYGAPPAYAPAAGGFGAAPSQTGGFLRGAAQTAAGVAAGALAFEGIESLMHGFGHSAGYGSDMGGFGGFGGQGRPEEVVVNNYYGDDSDREERRDDGGQFADSSYDSGNDDVADDASFDDGSGSGDDFGSGGDTFDV